MPVNSFQDLHIWQKSHELTLKIYTHTKAFPSDERFGLSSQIRRSSVSICANIVEGYSKSTKEFIRFLQISRASLEETKYHLILAKDLGYLNVTDFKVLFSETEEIGRMLYSLMQNIRSRTYH